MKSRKQNNHVEGFSLWMRWFHFTPDWIRLEFGESPGWWLKLALTLKDGLNDRKIENRTQPMTEKCNPPYVRAVMHHSHDERLSERDVELLGEQTL